MSAPDIDISPTEIAQTIITISTALVVGRDMEPRAAADRAVEIIEAALSRVDAVLYCMGVLPDDQLRVGERPAKELGGPAL